jgi:hypothetical protein
MARSAYRRQATMTEKSSAHVELTIALPLDVVANKLWRIEKELRSLNMKVLNFEQERDSGDLNGLIGVRLARIHETLDSIRACLSHLDADIQPTRYVTESSVDDSSEYRKPRPDRDD